MDDIRQYRVKTLAFIPARAGSVGIKDKNLQRLGGKTLIQWAIAAAKQTTGIDHIVLSTDIPKTLIPMEHIYGVEIVDRPEHLRDGLSYTIADVVINYLATQYETYDLVALFQPTSPFVKPQQAATCIETLKLHGGNLMFNSAQTVCTIPHNYHAYNQRFIKDGHSVEFLSPKRREDSPHKQDKPTLYRFGNFVVARVDKLSPGGGMFISPSWPLTVNWKHAIDIDTQEELDIANLLCGMGLV
jgi:N-acylneuraminate cytidylyltransferase|tara:strand:- start:12877 stop:13605 length:729 start_codon:yes stop_codon:yes gene_type:complete